MKTQHRDIPLYGQLKKSLTDQIQIGFYLPEQPIPSERTLCHHYGISRITVRRCLSEMIYEGLLYRKHGKGTFVARPKIKQGLARIVNFSQTLLSLGMQPSTSILSAEATTADVEVVKEFGLPPDSSVLKLVFLGRGDEEPLVLYESFFLPETGQRIVKIARQCERKGIPFSTFDLYQEMDPVPSTINQSFEAVIANERLSSLLKIPKGSPILRIQSVFLNLQ